MTAKRGELLAMQKRGLKRANPGIRRDQEGVIGAFALTGVLEVQAAVTESSRAVCDVPGVCRLSLLHRAKLVETGKPLSELIKSDSFLIHWLLPLIITKQLSPRLPLNTIFQILFPCQAYPLTQRSLPTLPMKTVV